MIRVAVPADVEAVAAIESACFGAAAWSEALVADEIASERHVVLVTDDLTAYGAVALAGEDADLDRIGVVPEARGTGLARELLGALIDRARDLGVGRMLLEVAADNAPALGLYESFGFDVISRRTAYYPHGVDALVMEIAIEEWR